MDELNAADEDKLAADEDAEMKDETANQEELAAKPKAREVKGDMLIKRKKI